MQERTLYPDPFNLCSHVPAARPRSGKLLSRQLGVKRAQENYELRNRNARAGKKLQGRRSLASSYRLTERAKTRVLFAILLGSN